MTYFRLSREISELRSLSFSRLCSRRSSHSVRPSSPPETGTHTQSILQTKVERAAALAGGDDWAFPCGPDSDSNAQGTGIVDVARAVLRFP